MPYEKQTHMGRLFAMLASTRAVVIAALALLANRRHSPNLDRRLEMLADGVELSDNSRVGLKLKA
jgi:hypothetical protein